PAQPAPPGPGDGRRVGPQDQLRRHLRGRLAHLRHRRRGRRLHPGGGVRLPGRAGPPGGHGRGPDALRQTAGDRGASVDRLDHRSRQGDPGRRRPARGLRGIHMSEIYMPRLSDTMEEGVISSWVKKVGDKVASGDVLVEIETDKAVVEYEAYEDGYLVKQAVSEGEMAPIGAVIASSGDLPEAVPAESDSAAPGGAPAGWKPGEPAAEENRAAAPAAPAAAPAEGEEAVRPRTSPLARRLAKEYGLD